MRNADFAEMIDFTRPGRATYIDADGMIRIAAADVPRFDYTNGRRQLLLEGPTTGLGGAEINPRVWGQAATTFADYDEPLGDLNNAVRIASGGASFNLASSPSITNVASGSKVSISVVIKQGTSGRFRVRIRDTIANDYSQVIMDLVSGDTQSRNNLGPMELVSVRDLAEGAMLLKFRITLSQDIGLNFLAGPDSDVLGEDVIVYAAQAEIGNPSSIIANDQPASGTRVADNAAINADVAELMVRNEVSLVLQGEGFIGSAARFLGYGGVGRHANLSLSEDTILIGEAGVYPIAKDIATPIPHYGLAIASDPDGKMGAYNGDAPTGNSAPLTKASLLFLGRSGSAYIANGWYDRLIIWPFRMTDEDLQRLAVPYA